MFPLGGKAAAGESANGILHHLPDAPNRRRRISTGDRM